MAGRERKSPRRDVEFTYVIGRESIEHRRASLEALIAEVNQLEKQLLRVKSSLATARSAKTLRQVRPEQLRSTIDGTRLSMRRIRAVAETANGPRSHPAAAINCVRDGVSWEGSRRKGILIVSV